MSITVNPSLWARTSINRAVACVANVCVQNAVLCCDATTTSMCLIDSCLAITVANRCGGDYWAMVGFEDSNSMFQNNVFTLADDGVSCITTVDTINVSTHKFGHGLMRGGALDGSVIRLRWRVTSGTGTIRAGGRIDSFEVGG